jgi:hypothetical protein
MHMYIYMMCLHTYICTCNVSTHTCVYIFRYVLNFLTLSLKDTRSHFSCLLSAFSSKYSLICICVSYVLRMYVFLLTFIYMHTYAHTYVMNLQLTYNYHSDIFRIFMSVLPNLSRRN